MNSIISIEQAPNGYIVRGELGGGWTPKTLAVFNDVKDLAKWIEENFQLPIEENFQLPIEGDAL